MSPPPSRLVLAAGALLLLPAIPLAADGAGVVAVYAAASPAYTRTPLPGGGFKPETYAFGEGGRWGGSLKDFSIDRLRFLDVARLLAPSLAARQYVPADPKAPDRTDLLLMVYWGTTSGTNDTATSPEYQIAQSLMGPGSASPLPPSNRSFLAGSGERQQRSVLEGGRDSALAQADLMIAMANRRRDRTNAENAMVLGYLPDLRRTDGYQGTALGFIRGDIVDDVEESRYFVVLLAYDFQLLWKQKQRKLLWEARFSLPERRNEFDKALLVMAQQASRFFGEDSHGLVRRRLPDVNVIIGNPKFLEFEPGAK